MLFIKDRAAAAGAGMPIPVFTTNDEPQLTIKQEKKQERSHHDQNPRYKAAVHSSTSTPAYRYECVICTPDKHPLYQCQKFRDMDVKMRRDKVRTLKLCFNCFVPGHRNNECRNPSTCRVCSGKHITLLHQEPSPNAQARPSCLVCTQSATALSVA